MNSQVTNMMATRFNLDHDQFIKTVKATCIKEDVTNEQFVQFLLVASEYDLNPFTKEIYAFPSRGGIQPIVSIDGWLKIINARAEFDGMEFEDHLDDGGKLSSVTCRIYRLDRKHPTEVTEYMSECKRSTDTWKNWPARMLRHKATIQAARYAFGLSGIVDPDEGERIREAIHMDDADVVDNGAVKMPKRLNCDSIGNERTGEQPAVEQQRKSETGNPATEKQRNMVFAKIKNAEISTQIFEEEFGKLDDLPFASVNKALEWISKFTPTTDPAY